MKRFTILIYVLLFLNVFNVCGQTTWVKTYNIDEIIGPMGHDSTNTGPKELCVTPNGTIITLIQRNQNQDEWIIAFDSLGNLLWHIDAAYSGNLSSRYCFSLHPTSDNGCVYVYRHDGGGPPFIEDSVFRIGSNGVPIWTKFFNGYTSFNLLVKSITPTFQNTFLLQFRDSLVELDSLGNFIRTRSPFSGNITTINDTDFILSTDTTISRESFFGTQSWNINAAQFQAASANLSFIYALSVNQVMKVNTLNGNIIWTKPITVNKLSSTSDDGFIAIYGDQLSKYDSSGTLQWTKTISLPQFGLKVISEISSNTYITGGCWKSIDLNYQPFTGFSPMMIRLDSIGNGTVDSTDFFYTGNANDNNELTFGDDAVYIAAAINSIGPPRDSLVRGRGGKNVYCVEWPDSFFTGVNHKFSDYDGNGVIDTADISSMGQMYGYGHIVTPHWNRESHSTNPVLRFDIENDSISFTDTLKVNVILGSPGTPIDSIYGLSFDIRFGQFLIGLGQNLNPFYTINPNNLGDTSVNLLTRMFYNNSGLATTMMVLCRQDLINAYVDGDTISKLNFILNPALYMTDTVTMQINWNAITKGGFPVTLDIIADTLFMSPIMGINKIENNQIKIFPNPANQQITFSFNSENINELNILDETGRIILSTKISGSKYFADVSDFADGIYYISALSSDKIIRSKFLVIH